ACDDMLTETPHSFLTVDNFYQSAGDARAALNAVYQQLSSAIGGSVGSWQHSFVTDGASDHSNAHPLDQNPPAQHPGTLGWDTENSFMNDSWYTWYRQIYRANLMINRVADAPISQDLKNVYVAEARFLRAFAYHQLERYYGGVPLFKTEEEHANLQVSRSSREEINKFVIDELIAIEPTLLASHPPSDWGRATRGAARAMLTERYIWNSSRYNSGEWQKASDMAKKIIDSGTYQLLPNQLNVFLPTNKGNREMIFASVHTGVDNRSSSTIQNSHYPRELTPGGGFGVTTPTIWAADSFDDGDYRKQTSFRFAACNLNNTTCFCDRRVPTCDNSSSRRWLGPTGSHPYKFRPSSQSVGARGDVDFPIWRYAEVLLWYAEAQNELGNSALAMQQVNLIRARARNGTGTENRALPANRPTNVSKVQARDWIYWERHLELIWETKRWLDLIRRDAMEPGVWAATLTANDPIATTLGPVKGQEFRMLRAIPARETQNLPNVKQNPGY
ncbi:MAG: RagB/SusD family nutrient uptake outer membrane protein, partial [Gemmatimonadetes bacterium]|nr:RagB/SusD family nutrient uptake outer membrane protein [Gemmatimonadota bacterium]